MRRYSAGKGNGSRGISSAWGPSCAQARPASKTQPRLSLCTPNLESPCDREVFSPRFYTAQATHNCHEQPCTAPINKTRRNLNGGCLHLHAVPWANLMLLSHRRRLVLKAPHIVLRHTDKSQAPRIQGCRRFRDARRTQGRGVCGTISNRNCTRSMPRRPYQ